MYSGCSKSNVINEDKFVNVYIDLVVARDTVSNTELPEIKQKIFKKFNITEAQYKNTLKFYNKKPERWQKFFSKVNNKIRQLKKAAK